MLLYWLWLSLRSGVSHSEMQMLLEHFATPEDLYFADDEALSQLPELSRKAAASLLDKSCDEAEKILETCVNRGVSILHIRDPRYPQALRVIPDPPVVLYWRGRLPELDKHPIIGVVGTRKASAYGLESARRLGQQLAAHGAIVVSGMAAGIDGAATLGALEGNGTVLGILGCGVDIVYPRSNRDLFDEVGFRGCLISEYPPGTPPNSWHFPQRNRIISGLSRGVLIVEAPEKSGALITARQAMDQGRDVFVVPGNLGLATFQGSNNLLRAGAIAATCGWDILSEYQQDYPGLLRRDLPKEPAPLPVRKAAEVVPAPKQAVPEPLPDDLEPPEQAILAALGSEERHMDTLIAGIDLPSGDVLAALTMLEVKGFITTRPGGWVKASKNH